MPKGILFLDIDDTLTKCLVVPKNLENVKRLIREVRLQNWLIYTNTNRPFTLQFLLDIWGIKVDGHCTNNSSAFGIPYAGSAKNWLLKTEYLQKKSNIDSECDKYSLSNSIMVDDNKNTVDELIQLGYKAVHSPDGITSEICNRVLHCIKDFT